MLYFYENNLRIFIIILRHTRSSCEQIHVYQGHECKVLSTGCVTSCRILVDCQRTCAIKQRQYTKNQHTISSQSRTPEVLPIQSVTWLSSEGMMMYIFHRYKVMYAMTPSFLGLDKWHCIVGRGPNAKCSLHVGRGHAAIGYELNLRMRYRACSLHVGRGPFATGYELN